MGYFFRSVSSIDVQHHWECVTVADGPFIPPPPSPVPSCSFDINISLKNWKRGLEDHGIWVSKTKYCIFWVFWSFFMAFCLNLLSLFSCTIHFTLRESPSHSESLVKILTYNSNPFHKNTSYWCFLTILWVFWLRALALLRYAHSKHSRQWVAAQNVKS